MIPTGLTALAVGIQHLSATGMGVLAYIVANLTMYGSMILSGNIYLLNDLVTPAVYVNQNAVMTFESTGGVTFESGSLAIGAGSYPSLLDDSTSESFLTSDRIAMAAPTGGTNHYVAVAPVPFTNGTGAVIGGALLCKGTPNAMNVEITVSTSTTASGTSLVRDTVGIFTGAVIRFNSGSLIKVPTNSYLSIVSESGSNVTRQSPDCDLVPHWIEV